MFGVELTDVASSTCDLVSSVLMDSIPPVGIFSDRVLGILFGLSLVPTMQEPVKAGLEPVR